MKSGMLIKLGSSENQVNTKDKETDILDLGLRTSSNYRTTWHTLQNRSKLRETHMFKNDPLKTDCLYELLLPTQSMSETDSESSKLQTDAIHFTI